MIQSLSYIIDLFKINFRSAVSLRWAFIARSIFMAANNLIYFCTWLLMFNSFKEIGGWNVQHMMVLYAIGSGGFGLFVIFANGLRDLSIQIENGELDTYLLYPHPVLLSAAGKSTDPSGIGEIITTLILCGFAWPLTAQYWPIILLAISLAAIMWASLATIFESVAFWAKDISEWAANMHMSCIIVGTNPTNIYGDVFKILIFTIFPVGYFTFFPIEYMRQNQPEFLLYAICGVLAFALFAIWFFYHGLKRYESGNRFGVRG